MVNEPQGNGEKIMSKKWKTVLITISFMLVVVVILSRTIFSQSATKAVLPEVESTNLAERGFSNDEYSSVLAADVDDYGMVNYKGLKAKRGELDSFAASMAALDPNVFAKWSDKRKIAFWINAYNAFTLIAIINNYPIKSTFLGRRLYPGNSIRQIDGVWDELKFRVMGRDMTLDEIEHENLRRYFNEPRIHMALVCAAMGCPSLRNEPFTEEHLDAQLDDQTRRLLGNPLKFRIDREKNRVYLSSIFKWFGTDFEKKYGTDVIVSGNTTEKAVLNYVSKYLEEKDRQYMRTAKYNVGYLSYDWSLNEQKGE